MTTIEELKSIFAKKVAERERGYDPSRFSESYALKSDAKRFQKLFATYAKAHKLPEPVGEVIGCGGFGCVWKTSKPGVVLKATKDESEARIVRMLMGGKTKLDGFVRYKAHGSVEGYDLLWREDVEPYEGEDSPVLDSYQLYASTAKLIEDDIEFKDEWQSLISELAAATAEWKVAPSKGKGNVPVTINGKLRDLSSWEPEEDFTENAGKRFVVAWRAARVAAATMQKDAELRHVAEAILWALSKGVMLCDVSYSNLGWVSRGGKRVLVIYDPGYTVEVPASVIGVKRNPAATPEEYRGQHEASDKSSGAPLWDVCANGIYPEDFYSYNGFRYYSADTGPGDSEAYGIVMSKHYAPNNPIKIYRAAPKNAKGINKGDWVTIARAYAKAHGEGALNGDYRIISKTVYVRDLFTSGDSILEWGYDPQPRVSDQDRIGQMPPGEAKRRLERLGPNASASIRKLLEERAASGAKRNPLPAIKTCGCGRSYTQQTWEQLPLAKVKGHPSGRVKYDEDLILEYRNCPCKSTLTVEVEDDGRQENPSPGPSADLLMPANKLPGVGKEKTVRVEKNVVLYKDPYGSSRFVLFDRSKPICALQVVSTGDQNVVANVYTVEDRRRQGLASKLFQVATRVLGRIEQSEHLSEDGAAWRHAIERSQSEMGSNDPSRQENPSLVPLNVSAIDKVAGRLAQQLLQNNSMIAEETVQVRRADGKKHKVWINVLSSPFTKGRVPGTLFVKLGRHHDPSDDPEAWDKTRTVTVIIDADRILQYTGEAGLLKTKSVLRRDLRLILLHELTHSAEPKLTTPKYSRTEPTLKSYYRDPQEVRANTREIVDSILHGNVKARTLDYQEAWAGGYSGTLVEFLADTTELWRHMHPFLEPAAEKRTLQVIERALRDNGIDTQGQGALPKENPMAKKFTLADAVDAGIKLGVNWKTSSFSPEALHEGILVELEHKDVTRGGLLPTARIALAHLNECSDYYARLRPMEKACKSKAKRSKNPKEATRADFVKACGGEDNAIGVELACLTHSARDLPSCAIDVIRHTGGPTPEYWAWLCKQAEAGRTKNPGGPVLGPRSPAPARAGRDEQTFASVVSRVHSKLAGRRKSNPDDGDAIETAVDALGDGLQAAGVDLGRVPEARVAEALMDLGVEEGDVGTASEDLASWG